jgi:hypothetical protein
MMKASEEERLVEEGEPAKVETEKVADFAMDRLEPE